MNKIVLYVGLAILLGTVSMVAPLALLNDGNQLSDDKFLFTPSRGTLENQTSECSDNNQTLGLDSTSDYFSIPPPADPQFTDSEIGPKGVETTSGIVTSGEPLASDNSVADLSPVALITVPSFLVALGVFVILRRQAS